MQSFKWKGRYTTQPTTSRGARKRQPHGYYDQLAKLDARLKRLGIEPKVDLNR